MWDGEAAVAGVGNVVSHRSLWLGFAACVLFAGPAAAHGSGVTFLSILFSWVFGVAYLMVMPLALLALGMGWRVLAITLATALWVAVCDFTAFGFIGLLPHGWRVAALVVLGGALCVLLRELFAVVARPRRTSFLRWQRAGWLHRAHAVFLVCAACLAMGPVVVAGIAGEGLSLRDKQDHSDIQGSLDPRIQMERFV